MVPKRRLDRPFGKFAPCLLHRDSPRNHPFGLRQAQGQDALLHPCRYPAGIDRRVQFKHPTKIRGPAFTNNGAACRGIRIPTPSDRDFGTVQVDFQTVFADAGHAAMKVDELASYGDAGVGLRVLIPQLNAEVLRFDWAFNFRTAYVPAGWPGRLSFGFRQAF